MKRFLAVLVLLIALSAIVGWVFLTFQQKIFTQKLALERATIGTLFMGRLAGTRMLPDETYIDDIGVLLSSYGRDIDKMYQSPEYAKLRNPNAMREMYLEEFQKGRLDDRTFQGINERIDYTQEAYKALTSGSYRPLTTAQNLGFRLDMYEINKTAIDGQDRLMVKVLIHAGDPESLSFGRIEMKMRIEDEVEKQVKGKTVTETVAKMAKVEGGGEPNTLVKEPRKRMEDFPPGLMIGYYDFPLFPPTARELKLTMSFTVRTAGGNSFSPNLEFAVIPISPSWRLPEGASWEAEEMEATEEEAAEFTK